MLKTLSVWHICAGLTCVWLTTAALQFPMDTDGPIDRAGQQAAFYSTAYDTPRSVSDAESAREQRYVEIATRAAEAADIEGIVERFVHTFNLRKKTVLDVGSPLAAAIFKTQWRTTPVLTSRLPPHAFTIRGLYLDQRQQCLSKIVHLTRSGRSGYSNTYRTQRLPFPRSDAFSNQEARCC
jgi:hypothetical protein